MTEPAYQPFPAFAAWADLPLDHDTLDRYFALLDGLRASSDPADLARAVDTATRAAAIDTGAIEGLYEVDRGFTMTVAVRGAAWEAVVAAREPVVRESFADALRAYEYVLDLATARTEVTEKSIREIHSQICASQETYSVVTSLGVQKRPLPKGEYKETPNNPTSLRTGRIHAYASPIDVSAEMQRLVMEMRSATFAAAPPVLQAAYAHYAFVAIHPFADGNGRVARALASVFLYRYPGVPLVVFADQKDAYLDGLENADAGSPARFVRFIQERVIDMIGLVELSAGHVEPSVTASVDALRTVVLERRALSDQEVEAIEERVVAAVLNELQTQVAALDLPDGVAVTAEVNSADGCVDLQGRVFSIPSTNVMITLGKSGSGFRALYVTGFDRDRVLDVELRDVVPTTSTVLQLKLRMFTEEILRIVLARLADEARRQAQPKFR